MEDEQGCPTTWWTENSAPGVTGTIRTYHECFGTPEHGGTCACPCGAVRLVTKTGKVLTDEDLETLAAEAEAGYDLDQLRERSFDQQQQGEPT
jgi:hypothetical protein